MLDFWASQNLEKCLKIEEKWGHKPVTSLVSQIDGNKATVLLPRKVKHVSFNSRKQSVKYRCDYHQKIN